MRKVIYRLLYFVPDPFLSTRYAAGALTMFHDPPGGQHVGMPRTHWDMFPTLPNFRKRETRACLRMGLEYMDERASWSLHVLPCALGPHWVLGPICESTTEDPDAFLRSLWPHDPGVA